MEPDQMTNVSNPSLQLKVGECYRDAEGRKVEVVGKSKFGNFIGAREGDDRRLYRDNGEPVYSVAKRLISEWTEPQASTDGWIERKGGECPVQAPAQAPAFAVNFVSPDLEKSSHQVSPRFARAAGDWS